MFFRTAKNTKCSKSHDFSTKATLRAESFPGSRHSRMIPPTNPTRQKSPASVNVRQLGRGELLAVDLVRRDLYHVSGSVSESPGLLILTRQDKRPQLGFIDPVNPTDDLQRSENPP